MVHGRLPQSRYKPGDKAFKKAVTAQLTKTREQLVSVQQRIREETGKIIDEEIESRIGRSVEFCLKEVRLVLELLVENEILSQKEISLKRAELKGIKEEEFPDELKAKIEIG